VQEVLDHLIDATARQVIAPMRDLVAGKIAGPSRREGHGGPALRPMQNRREEMARLLEEVVVLAYHRLHLLDHVQQIETIKSDPRYPACWDRPGASARSASLSRWRLFSGSDSAVESARKTVSTPAAR
jgi:hypothetical protein